MLLVVEILALQLAWLGCVPVYCAAKPQRIFPHPLPKPLAWLSFIVATLLAVWMLSHIYLWLTAWLIVMVVVMVVWILLAIIMPHCNRFSVVSPVLAVLMLLMALLGDSHVA